MKLVEIPFDSCEHGRENISCQDCYISLFRSIAESIYDNECPITETEIVVKDNAPWYDRKLAWAKREKRKKREKVEKCQKRRVKK